MPSKPEKQATKQAEPKGKETRFKPGQSGNPKGRPKKELCLTTQLKDELKKIPEQDKQGRTWLQLIVLATIQLAVKGNATALKEIWERIDGKTKQPIDIDQKVEHVFNDTKDHELAGELSAFLAGLDAARAGKAPASGNGNGKAKLSGIRGNGQKGLPTG